MAEANKYAAGAWKRATVTQGQWAFLEAFQAWRRGEHGIGAGARQVRALLTDKRKAYAPTHTDRGNRWSASKRSSSRRRGRAGDRPRARPGRPRGAGAGGRAHFGSGTSSRNSEVIHAGIYYAPAR